MGLELPASEGSSGLKIINNLSVTTKIQEISMIAEKAEKEAHVSKTENWFQSKSTLRHGPFLGGSKASNRQNL